MRRIRSKLIMLLILTSLLTGTLLLALNDQKKKKAACDVEIQNIYLALQETYLLPSTDYSVTDPEIAVINENILIALKAGETQISDGCFVYRIKVSGLYTVPEIRHDKPYLPDGTYSDEENAYLDEVLAYLIADKGIKTRAAAVEAARFLTLRFPYKLEYFYENGRLDPQAEYHVDGEGRYYHTGLYLSVSKYDGITLSENGPAYWGKKLFEDYNEEYKSNGLDCSGFITWALYNAGYDVGDIGAGPSDDVYDLSDIGRKVMIDVLDLNELKVGDLIGLEGHIGMIIGIENDRIHIAEAYWVKDLQVRSYSFHELKEEAEWEYAVLMDSFYGETGNLSTMWQ